MVEFFWYPKCGTCRKARRWLEDNGVEFNPVDLKECKPRRDQLEDWLGKSGLPLKKLFNTSGLAYKELGLKDRLPAMGRDEQLDLLASDGMLVRRPVLVAGGTVLVGFKEADWEAGLK